jgi:His-Xaa-Ser system protein HxsD
VTDEVAFVGVRNTLGLPVLLCAVGQMAQMSGPLNAAIVVDFNASMQSLGALQEAAYRLIGQAACQIDEADGRYVCRLSPSQPQYQGEELRVHFLNLVTDENLREKVSRETDRLRDVIVALAFGSLAQGE